MTGSYKIFKTFLLLLGLVQVGRPQAPTFESISQNFCLENLGEEDNFSCIGTTIEGVACFDRDLLCDDTVDCPGGEDEGLTIAPLECERGAGSYN